MVIVDHFQGKQVRFVSHIGLGCGIGILSEDLSHIDNEFPSEGILTPIEFGKFVSRSGKIDLCCWVFNRLSGLVVGELYEDYISPLYEISLEATCSNYDSISSEQYRLTNWLKRINEFLPECELLNWSEVKSSLKIKTNKTPDFVVKLHGEIIPGEAKVVPFTIGHLRQLTGYMDLLKTKKGIALAPSLKCDLPNGVNFIKL